MNDREVLEKLADILIKAEDCWRYDVEEILKPYGKKSAFKKWWEGSLIMSVERPMTRMEIARETWNEAIREACSQLGLGHPDRFVVRNLREDRP
jgi:hypothetical protein